MAYDVVLGKSTLLATLMYFSGALVLNSRYFIAITFRTLPLYVGVGLIDKTIDVDL